MSSVVGAESPGAESVAQPGCGPASSLCPCSPEQPRAQVCVWPADPPPPPVCPAHTGPRPPDDGEGPKGGPGPRGGEPLQEDQTPRGAPSLLGRRAALTPQALEVPSAPACCRVLQGDSRLRLPSPGPRPFPGRATPPPGAGHAPSQGCTHPGARLTQRCEAPTEPGKLLCLLEAACCIAHWGSCSDPMPGCPGDAAPKEGCPVGTAAAQAAALDPDALCHSPASVVGKMPRGSHGKPQ